MSATETSFITEEAANFIEGVGFEDLADDAVTIARRCILDGLGLYVAGSAETSVKILGDDALDQPYAVFGRVEYHHIA